jgi:putative AlgH/UPF0301 family transcriptional regulator
MNRFTAMLPAVALLAILRVGAADAVDVTQPTLLVASTRLDGSPLEQTVIIVSPIPSGGHIGFIVNRPTTVKLDALFPDDAAVRNVVEPVSLGGPLLSRAVFALTQHVPDGIDSAMPVMPGVYAVLDAPGVDHLIETTPNDARYFLGLMAWQPDELEAQIEGGLWDARAADADMVFARRSTGLWDALHRPMTRVIDHCPGDRADESTRT